MKHKIETLRYLLFVMLFLPAELLLGALIELPVIVSACQQKPMHAFFVVMFYVLGIFPSLFVIIIELPALLAAMKDISVATVVFSILWNVPIVALAVWGIVTFLEWLSEEIFDYVCRSSILSKFCSSMCLFGFFLLTANVIHAKYFLSTIGTSVPNYEYVFSFSDLNSIWRLDGIIGTVGLVIFAVFMWRDYKKSG